jgi:hypothetical protein
MPVRPILGRKYTATSAIKSSPTVSKPLLIPAKTGIDPKRIESQRVQIKFPRRATTMRIKLNYIAPGLAAAAIGGAIALAPIASADTDPLVPYGTNPQVPYVLGFHESNHDEADTTNGQLDLPF